MRAFWILLLVALARGVTSAPIIRQHEDTLAPALPRRRLLRSCTRGAYAACTNV